MPHRVLMIHTGGTLGMEGTPLSPGSYAGKLVELVPELKALADVQTHILCNLDSSDVGPNQWSDLVRLIAQRHEDVDGFVIVHGTDTMAYSASALAFALPGLTKPVVFTGAQRPLARVRTDARRNLVDAIEVATRAEVGEVCICFDGVLLRGCRARKNNAEHYRAFDSPGTEPLGHLGVHLQFAPSLRAPASSFASYDRFDSHVQVAWTAPGTTPIVLYGMAEDGARGVVLVAFGVGNAPLGTGWPNAVADLAARGVDVLVVSQAGGMVDLSMYQNGVALREAGAVSGGRMTVEAAVAKLMHGLARFPDRAERHQWLQTDVAGEGA